MKDVQGVAAAMENILLAIHLIGLGGVWLGEILNQKEMVDKIIWDGNKEDKILIPNLVINSLEEIFRN